MAAGEVEDVKPVRGELANLQAIIDETPDGSAQAVREVAQRECDAESRAHDALLARGNNLLAASGVALSLLIGMSKDIGSKTTFQKVFLLAALLAAIFAGVLVLVGSRLVRADVSMKNTTIVGKHIPKETKTADWSRAYDLSLALTYCEIRMAIKGTHSGRAFWLLGAQWSYFAFVCCVSVLGVSLVT